MKVKNYGRDFTLVVVGQIVSLFGNATLRFSLPLYLLRETGSPALFGSVTALSLLPMILLSMLGGVLADRVNKRNIMVALDFTTAVIMAGCYFLIGKVAILPLLIVVLMLLFGISGAYQPAVQASIPALVPKDQILPAGAIVNQIGALANFTGPMIGGMVYGAWGIGAILKVSTICFFLSAVMELFIVIPFHQRPWQKSVFAIVKSDLKDSLRFLREEKPVFIQVCIIISALNLFLSAMLTIGVPVLVIGHLDMTDQMLGITQGLFAVGGILGGFLTFVFEKKLRPYKASVFLYLCALFICIMGLGIMLPGSILWKYGILSGMGLAATVSATMFSIQMLAVVQTETPQHFVGKVVACIMTFVMCAQPVGQLIYGVLFDRLANLSIPIIGAGLVSMGIAIYAKKHSRN